MKLAPLLLYTDDTIILKGHFLSVTESSTDHHVRYLSCQTYRQLRWSLEHSKCLRPSCHRGLSWVSYFLTLVAASELCPRVLLPSFLKWALCGASLCAAASLPVSSMATTGHKGKNCTELLEKRLTAESFFTG